MIGLSSIAGDRLLRQIMVSGRVSDAELERVLTVARRALLDAASGPHAVDADMLEFFCALAQQCFLNEYVFAETDAEERTGIAPLAATLAERLRAGDDVAPLTLAAVAAYRPLHALADADALLGRIWPAPIERLLTLQVREPREEAAIRAGLPALTAVGDGVSRDVQAQYEENPYPRWVMAPPAVRSFRADDYFAEKSFHARRFVRCPASTRTLSTS